MSVTNEPTRERSDPFFFFWFINKQLIIMLTTQQCSKAWQHCDHRITRYARYPALTRYCGQIGVETRLVYVWTNCSCYN